MAATPSASLNHAAAAAASVAVACAGERCSFANSAFFSPLNLATAHRSPFGLAAAPFRLHLNPLRFRSFPTVYAFSSNDIKVGSNIEVDGAPWKVLEFLHVKPGKGAAFVRTKVRNYLTGNIVDKTFRAGSSIEVADIFKETKQFTYMDGNRYVFMDLTNYEEIGLTDAEIGDNKKWLTEGLECNLLFWNGRVIDVELPLNIKVKVIDAPPGVKGDSVQGATKTATIETGADLTVPVFVNTGDEIIVDTRTGQYVSRA